MLKNFIKVHKEERPLEILLIRYTDIIRIASDPYGIHSRLLVICYDNEEKGTEEFRCWESVDEIVNLIKKAEGES